MTEKITPKLKLPWKVGPILSPRGLPHDEPDHYQAVDSAGEPALYYDGIYDQGVGLTPAQARLAAWALGRHDLLVEALEKAQELITALLSRTRLVTVAEGDLHRFLQSVLVSEVMDFPEGVPAEPDGDEVVDGCAPPRPGLDKLEGGQADG